MVDSVPAQRAQNASGVGGSERARTRGSVDSVRGVERTGQQAFGSSFAEATSILQAASNDQTAVGSGLLSTGVQVLLAETRSQEATAPFVAPSKLGQAINTYIETQGQVRDTIRANTGPVLPASSPTTVRSGDDFVSEDGIDAAQPLSEQPARDKAVVQQARNSVSDLV